MKCLGHRNAKNTLIYMNLESKFFNRIGDVFTLRIAHNAGEACSLVESGFEYVAGEYSDGGRIFRKRKGREFSTVQ